MNCRLCNKGIGLDSSRVYCGGCLVAWSAGWGRGIAEATLGWWIIGGLVWWLL